MNGKEPPNYERHTEVSIATEYVVSRALAGRFHVPGKEERKIRKDPGARVIDLLKKEFGK